MTPFTHLMLTFKSASALARLLNLHRATVLRWKKSPIPDRHIRTIQELSNFKLKVQHLKPELLD